MAVPDAALGLVDDPPEADAVLRVVDHPQVSGGVPHLLGVIEAVTADDPVGHAAFDQGLLDGVGLGVGPVEHGEIAVSPAVPDALQDGVRDEAALLLRVFQGDQLDFVPLAVGRPQGFALPVLVASDHRVGGAQYVLGGAVILFQPDDGAGGEFVLEMQDILNGGAAEFINTLVVVPHHAQVARMGGQKAD